MNRISTRRPRRAGLRTAVVIASLALTSACSTATEVLEVIDPDIINPSDVASPAGANAVRLGALARLNTATTGGESLLLLGGLFADEWINGDSFIARQEIDQRVITPQNNFLTDASRSLHRARLSAEQAIALLEEYDPTAPAANVAEMYFVQAYIENLAAEHFCNGLTFSSVVNGQEQFGDQLTVNQAFERALAHADAGIALITGTTAADVRVLNALRVVKGRILMNLDRPADAAAAVANVPTSFRYETQHAATATLNQIQQFNNLARRYSVSLNEGGNGLDFGTPGGDPRLPVCLGGDAACIAAGVTQTGRDDSTVPVRVQLLWPTESSPVDIVSGVTARLIEAEADLRANDGEGALTTLNALRATVGGLQPLAAVDVDVLFRERAFWHFGRGHRVGDMRRLIRQYDRAPDTVFPTGAWHKSGTYGNDVTMPVVLAESNNPNVPGANTCLDRNP